MIRPYDPKDLTAVMDIANRAWRGINEMFFRAYGEELFRILRPEAMTAKGEQVKAHCARTPEWCVICEEEGRIVGFATFALDRARGIGQILNNAADPDCGLRGIGPQMYRAVLERFRQEGMRYAEVSTGADEAHAPARKAYEKVGFNISHGEVKYYMKL